MSKRPIEPVEFSHGVNVVDIGDIRVARGKTRVPGPSCRHRTVTYDQNERRVYCEDCEQDIDGFDAFLMLVECHHAAIARVERRERELQEAEQFVARSRAVKCLDKIWRGRRMVPNCPHCGEGLLPEDVLNNQSASSAELTKRKRARTKV